MAIKTRKQLQDTFKNGATPDQQDFSDVFESFRHKEDNEVKVERANQTEAEQGNSDLKLMTPLRTKQAVDARRADVDQAEAGTSHDVLMTPLRTKQAVDARKSDSYSSSSSSDLATSRAVKDLRTSVIDPHQNSRDNPHGVTKAQVGLGNLPNAKSDSYGLANSMYLATSKAVRDLYHHLLGLINGKEKALPRGAVIMWSGNVNALPTGWALCDGTRGTPNLKGRFVVGYDPSDSDYNSIGDTGGEKKHTISVSEMPSHNHSGSTGSAGYHSHSGSTSEEGGHTHKFKNGYYVDIHSSQRAASGYYYIGGKVLGPHSYNHDNNYIYYHDYYTDSAGEHSHKLSISSAGSHAHYVSISSAGGNQAHENRPPYYALAFIMKL